MYTLPNKPEKITFDWLFDRINQEDVYLQYLGFCEINRKFTNPLRNDAKADCSFYWYNGVLFFKDFALNKSYTCVSILMQMKQITFSKALDEIYEAFLGGQKSDVTIVKINREKKTKQYKDIQVKIQQFTSMDIEYLKSFGITSELCKKYHVYSLAHYWVDGMLKYAYSTYNPVLGYYFNGRWKLYHYKASDYRFVSNTSHEDLQGYDELDWTGDLCVITKSLKDVMLYRRYGINAVAPHSEALSNWKEKIELLQKRFSKVIINFDNDKAGIRATDEVQKLYPLESFYIPDEKDLSDYYRKYGDVKTQEILKGLH